MEKEKPCFFKILDAFEKHYLVSRAKPSVYAVFVILLRAANKKHFAEITVENCKNYGVNKDTLRHALAWLSRNNFITINEKLAKNSLTTITIVGEKIAKVGENLANESTNQVGEKIAKVGEKIAKVGEKIAKVGENLANPIHYTAPARNVLKCSKTFTNSPLPEKSKEEETFDLETEKEKKENNPPAPQPKNQPTLEHQKKEAAFFQKGKEVVTLQNLIAYAKNMNVHSTGKAQAKFKEFIFWATLMCENEDFEFAWHDFAEMRAYSLNKPLSYETAYEIITPLKESGKTIDDMIYLLTIATKTISEYVYMPKKESALKQPKNAKLEHIEKLAPEIELLNKVDEICGKIFEKSEQNILAAKNALTKASESDLLKIVETCKKEWSADFFAKSSPKTFFNLEKLEERLKIATEPPKITMALILEIAKKGNPKNVEYYRPKIAHDKVILDFYIKMLNGTMLTSIFVQQCELYLKKIAA